MEDLSFKHNTTDSIYDSSTCKYDNLNLNQTLHYETADSVITNNVVFNDKKFSTNGKKNTGVTRVPDTIFVDIKDWQKTKNPYPLNIFNKTLPSNYLNSESSIKNKKPKIPEASNASNSTLSLHIADYENSIEGAGSVDGVNDRSKNDKETFFGECKNKMQISGLANKNPFEFPRQQEKDLTSEPEVTQFKASQKLLNPAEAEKDAFYNSLNESQKKMFEKFQNKHNEEILEAKMALHDKEEECEALSAKLAAVIGDKEVNQNPRKGNNYIEILKEELLSVGVDINNENQQPVIITNYIYYRLLKLLSQPREKRHMLLKLLGLSIHDNDTTVLKTNFFFKFDKKFLRKRENERKSSEKMANFDKEIVVFPKEQMPIITTAATTSQSDDDDDNEDSAIPLLEDMRMDTGEPLSKKSRIEPGIVNLPSTVNTESQTDLKLKNILELEGIKGKVKNLKKQIAYYKDKSGNLKEVNQNFEKVIADLEKEEDELEQKSDELNDLRNLKQKLNEEVRERDGTILELNEQLNNQKKSNKFFLKNHSGHFTVAAHTCFSRLITQGCVAQDKVKMVILILADLFGITVDAVPSRWTVGRDIHMVQALNCDWIAKLINLCSNLSWLSDETRKFTKSIQASVLAGTNKETGERFIVWIAATEVPTKSAERCLQEFKQVLSNIGKLAGFDADKFMEIVVISIRNLMGDQAATTKLVYKLFIAFRDECLQNSDFSETVKLSLGRVNTFFCLLHILSNSSAIVFEALLNHEKFCTNNEELTEATLGWVINEVARYFSKRSSGKHATAAQWETLAKKLELKFSKIDSNLGHRFVIRFIIAVEILYNREELIGFLEHLGNEDEALINLKNALKNELIILHLHVLALLGSLILQPMWQH